MAHFADHCAELQPPGQCLEGHGGHRAQGQLWGVLAPDGAGLVRGVLWPLGAKRPPGPLLLGPFSGM